MASINLANVNGDVTTDSGTIPAGQVGSEAGSGAVIGNGYVLTAGHIVYEFNRQHSGPAVTASSSVALDYKGYQAAYLAAAQSSYNATTGTYSANETVEDGLYTLDSVLISSSGVSVTSSSAGLGAFEDLNDLVQSRTVLPQSSVIARDGLNTGHVTGVIKDIFGGTDLEFNKPANTNTTSGLPGDSGGAYSLTYNKKTFIIGTQSSNKGNPAKTALGTTLTFSDIDNLTSVMTAGETGNLSTIEPTNLFVGDTSNDTINGSARPDVILGRDGTDALEGGDKAGSVNWGNDQLYGGTGDDTLIAGLGSNLYDGGDQALAASTAATLAADGIDTVDYSGLTSTDTNLGIEVDVTANATDKTWKANADFAHAIFVKDLGRDQGVDTLISVEKIVGTSADDTVKINQLSTTQLSNGSHLGGIDDIDLGGQTGTSANKGDLIDISGLNEAAKVTIDGTKTVVAAQGDATRTLTVDNAEYVVGSQNNDLFIDNGNPSTPATVEFKSGGGHDLVEINAGSGSYNLFLKGLNMNDITIIAGGEDLYTSLGGFSAPNASPDPYDLFEFFTFKINSTGDTITFTDQDKEIGSNQTPTDLSEGGTKYAASHSPISSVTFGNGKVLTADQLWKLIGNAGSNIELDLAYRGFDVGDYGNHTYIDRYFDHLNGTYFQADPLTSNSSSPAAASANTQAMMAAATATEQSTPSTQMTGSSADSPLMSAPGASAYGSPFDQWAHLLGGTRGIDAIGQNGVLASHRDTANDYAHSWIASGARVA